MCLAFKTFSQLYPSSGVQYVFPKHKRVAHYIYYTGLFLATNLLAGIMPIMTFILSQECCAVSRKQS